MATGPFSISWMLHSFGFFSYAAPTEVVYLLCPCVLVLKALLTFFRIQSPSLATRKSTFEAWATVNERHRPSPLNPSNLCSAAMASMAWLIL